MPSIQSHLKCEEMNVTDFDPLPNKGTAFSGIYDSQTGSWTMYPSGATTFKGGVSIPDGQIVPGRAGHRLVRERLMEVTGSTRPSSDYLGFTLFYEKSGEVTIEFFSRGANGPFNLKHYNRSSYTYNNLDDFLAPAEYHQTVISAVQEKLGVPVNYREYIPRKATWP